MTSTSAMTLPDPLLPLLHAAEAITMPLGDDEGAPQVVQTYGAYELEYAALRRSVGLFPTPWRGLLRLSGHEVKDFLHRMVTQDVRSMQGGDSRRSFLLNEKGRIIADLMIHHGEADTWLEMDKVDLLAARQALEGKLFSEDVTLEDFTAQRYPIELHGPGSLRLLQTVAGVDVKAVILPQAMGSTFPGAGTHHVITLAGAPVTVYQRDDLGELGLHLWVPTAQAAAVFAALVEAVGGLAPIAVDANHPALKGTASQGTGSTHEATNQPPRKSLGRGIGWLAYNTARVETGSAMFHIDFGPDCLPHETGLLAQTVSFTKGCYLGQEIVARMENLGHPKRVVRLLHLPDDRLPIAGAQVFDAQQQIIGAVTSSAVSPLRGQAAVALAMLRWGSHEPGTSLLIPAEGALVSATVVK